MKINECTHCKVVSPTHTHTHSRTIKWKWRAVGLKQVLGLSLLLPGSGRWAWTSVKWPAKRPASHRLTPFTHSNVKLKRRTQRDVYVIFSIDTKHRENERERLHSTQLILHSQLFSLVTPSQLQWTHNMTARTLIDFCPAAAERLVLCVPALPDW